MSTDKLILVAGATGLQGGAVIDALLVKGVSVRAIVRDKNSEAAKALTQKNVDVVEATFDDLGGLTKAANGTTGVFSVQMGTHPGNKGEETRHARNLVEAAKAAGVEHFVHTSVARAGEHEKFIGWSEGRWEPLYWEEKAAAIDAVKAAGFKYWTVIKPPFLMENLLPPRNLMMFPTITTGKIITPIGTDVKVDWASGVDVGRFAAEAFVRPGEFNKKEFAIVGDKLTMTEVADTLSIVTGKKFESISLSIGEAEKSELFKWGVDHFIWQNIEGYKINPQEAAVFGIQLQSMKNFLEQNNSALQEVYHEVL